MTQPNRNEQRRTDELKWRQDLYPRIQPDPETIQRYAEDLDVLPPVEINQNNEIIDGYHRWTAYRKNQVETIPVVVTPTISDKELLKLAIKRNSQHGLHLSITEKKDKVRELYTGKDGEKEELAELFSVTLRTISRWTERRDKDAKVARDRKIADMWLACYTEDEIAAETEISKATVSEAIRKCSELDTWQKLNIFANYQDPDWTPPLYDIWKRQEKTNKTNHFGNTETSFVDNLLYLYTEPFDIVVDPFAGGGSTIDVCKQRLRRYWVSDRAPIVERPDIRQWDIAAGPPPLHKRWSNVKLLYLDPPYWRQAAGQYSKDDADLANMPLDAFYAALTGFVTAATQKMAAGAHVALVISPTQYKADDRKYPVDHTIDIITRLQAYNKLRYIRRISIPYESQQYNAQQVEWAKANRDILILTREFTVWETVSDKSQA